MTMHSTETVMRPAAAALEAWFPVPVSAAADGSREALAVEQAEIRGEIAITVARMGGELNPDLLDELTDRVAGLLARAEEMRLALVLAARAAQ